MTTTFNSDTSTLEFSWPDGFPRIPDQDWAQAPLDTFGLSYDSVRAHGWYKNLEPTIAQILASLRQDDVLVDFSAGTGILASRLLSRINFPVGILNVDASPKFLRVAVENLRDDPRTAFRLIRFLREERRLQTIDESCEPPLLRRGVDQLVSTNAIHLYYDLPTTLESWTRVLRPGGLVFICSGNMNNPDAPDGQWIIDNTVEKVNDIVAELVLNEPLFARYRDNLTDDEKLAPHVKLRRKVFVPVRDRDYYIDTFDDCGFDVLHTFDATITARVDEWYQLLATYHDGVMSWVGGSPKADGVTPTEEDIRNRLFLIRYGLERLFLAADDFPCTWTYLTCRYRG